MFIVFIYLFFNTSSCLWASPLLLKRFSRNLVCNMHSSPVILFLMFLIIFDCWLSPGLSWLRWSWCGRCERWRRFSSDSPPPSTPWAWGQELWDGWCCWGPSSPRCPPSGCTPPPSCLSHSLSTTLLFYLENISSHSFLYSPHSDSPLVDRRKWAGFFLLNHLILFIFSSISSDFK